MMVRLISASAFTRKVVLPPLDKFKSLMESWGLPEWTLVSFNDDEATVNDGRLMKRTRGRDQNKWVEVMEEFIYISWKVWLQSTVIADHIDALSRLKQEQDPRQRGITWTGTFRCKCFISEAAEIFMSPRSHQHVPCHALWWGIVLWFTFQCSAVGVFVIFFLYGTK